MIGRFWAHFGSALFATFFFQGAAVAAGEKVVHDHGAHAQAVLQLDHGNKKWATDAALRDGMSAMRAAIAPQLAAIHHGKLDEAGYTALAVSLEQSMMGIFANCKLSPAADVQLHNLLVPMHADIGRMKEGASLKDRRQAAVAVMDGLSAYGRFFDHPGWKGLGH